MACTPLSVGLEVNPSQLRKILFNLDKLCNSDGSAQWKLHFELQERTDATQAYLSIIKLDVAITQENHQLAEATAKNGMDEDQRGQADAAADVAKAASQGQASPDDAKQAAQDVIAARNPNSPGA
jgi:hypothetical protein